MTERNLKTVTLQGKIQTVKKQKGMQIFQNITLVFLAFLWIGYGYALFCGNNHNISSYSLSILFFSILNCNVLFTKEKAANNVLNILAKTEGVLFFVSTIFNIIQLIIK